MPASRSTILTCSTQISVIFYLLLECCGERDRTKIKYWPNFQGALLPSIAPLLCFWASFGRSNAVEIEMR